MEKHTNIHALEYRHKEKVHVLSEKPHYMARQAQEIYPEQARGDRLSKHLHRSHEDLLETSEAEMEMPPDFEEPDLFLENISFVYEVPGFGNKGYRAPRQLKALDLEVIENRYNPREWSLQ